MRAPVAIVAALAAAAFAGTASAQPGRPSRGAAASAPSPAAFRAFLDGLWPQAAATGVSREVFDAAFGGLTPDPRVIALAGRQSEFQQPIGEYVEGAASTLRVARGRGLEGAWSRELARIEARTGVPAGIVLAVWGIESGFGAAPGGFDVVRSLATLAASGSRAATFRAELIDALVILQTEKLARSQLSGSWAGAMGQTQFLPSSFLAHAVDGDGDSRRDIWTSVPDVLGSIAGFLADSGWRRGLSWGYEVSVPNGIDLAIYRRSLADWARAGVVLADGGIMPEGGEASLYFPAGAAGPAFLLTENFEAIRAYNTSDSYALGVGLLGDRIDGGGALRRAWPKAAVLAGPERREVHRRLAAAGLYRGTPDGKFGAQTRDAVRSFQQSHGLPADGYADQALLQALRRAAISRRQ